MLNKAELAFAYDKGLKAERKRILNLINEYDDIYGLTEKDKLLYMVEHTKLDKDAKCTKGDEVKKC